MVTYLPSSDTTTITVLTAEVGTTLSISAPVEVIQGVSFDTFGVLQRIDTNAALDGETIELWVDGIFIDSMVTKYIGTPAGPQNGAYLFTHIIADTGPHTLEARFLGSERPGLVLGPSQTTKGLGVIMAVLQPIVAVVSAVLGAALVMLSLR